MTVATAIIDAAARAMRMESRLRMWFLQGGDAWAGAGTTGAVCLLHHPLSCVAGSFCGSLLRSLFGSLGSCGVAAMTTLLACDENGERAAFDGVGALGKGVPVIDRWVVGVKGDMPT